MDPENTITEAHSSTVANEEVVCIIMSQLKAEES